MEQLKFRLVTPNEVPKEIETIINPQKAPKYDLIAGKN